MTNQQSPNAFSMDCARAQDIIFDLQESEMEAGSGIAVAANDQALMYRHLADCDHCRAYRKTLSHMTGSLAQPELSPVPAGLEDRIMARISQEMSSIQAPVSANSRWQKYMPMAAAVLILALAIPLVFKTMNPSQNGSQLAQSPQGTPYAAELQPEDLTEVASLPAQIHSVEPIQASSDGNQGHPQLRMEQMEEISNAGNSHSPKMQEQQRHYNNPEHTEPYRGTLEDGQSSGGNYNVDPSALASAAPLQNVGQLGLDTLASDDEGDVYYDPVSNLVGF